MYVCVYVFKIMDFSQAQLDIFLKECCRSLHVIFEPKPRDFWLMHLFQKKPTPTRAYCLLHVYSGFLDPIPEFLKNMQIHFKFHKAYVIHCPFRDWFQSCYFIKPILPAISKPTFFQNCLMLYPHTVC